MITRSDFDYYSKLFFKELLSDKLLKGKLLTFLLYDFFKFNKLNNEKLYVMFGYGIE